MSFNRASFMGPRPSIAGSAAQMSDPNCWKDFRIEDKEDGGMAVYHSAQGMIMETESTSNIVERGSGGNAFIADGELTNFEVMARCRHLLEGRGTFHTPEANKGQDQNLDHPAPTVLEFPPYWDLNLGDYLPPHILQTLMQKYRHHYEQLVTQGYITVNGAYRLKVDSNLMLVAERMGPLTPQDYPRYAALLQDWSGAPQGVHCAWIGGLTKLKLLPEGGRQEWVLRRLITYAHAQQLADSNILREKVDAMLKVNYLSDEDLNINIPHAFGRMLGLFPPQDKYSDFWSQYYIDPAFTLHFDLAMLLNATLTLLRKAIKEPTKISVWEPNLREVSRRVSAIWKERSQTAWLGEWNTFVVAEEQEELYLFS